MCTYPEINSKPARLGLLESGLLPRAKSSGAPVSNKRGLWSQQIVFHRAFTWREDAIHSLWKRRTVPGVRAQSQLRKGTGPERHRQTKSERGERTQRAAENGRRKPDGAVYVHVRHSGSALIRTRLRNTHQVALCACQVRFSILEIQLALSCSQHHFAQSSLSESRTPARLLGAKDASWHRQSGRQLLQASPSKSTGSPHSAGRPHWLRTALDSERRRQRRPGSAGWPS